MKDNCKNCEIKKIKHEYQDKKFGEYVREFNKTKDENQRCTVCGVLKLNKGK